jgi:shikimate kinase
MLESMRPVLIGPVCAGKSTLAPLVAARLGLEAVDLDAVAERYYEEVGRSRAALHETGARLGDLGAYRWWQEGHPHAVRRVLEDHPAAVVSLGAGHSVYFDDALFADVREALSGDFVVFVLPSRDPERSMAVCRERALATNRMSWVMDGVDVLATWVTGTQNAALSDLTVFTEGRTADAVAREIVEAFSRRAAGGPRPGDRPGSS